MRASLLVLAGLFTSCVCNVPPQPCVEGDEPTCDAGVIPDFCDTQQMADDDAVNCHLVVNDAVGTTRKTDVFLSSLRDGGVDRDWYVAQLPTLTARSLLHVNGGYSSNTGVNFTLTVLEQQADAGLYAVATGINRPGTGAPKLVDLLVPYSKSGAKLYVLAADERSSTKNFDNLHPYSLLAQVIENPDVNEPNDATPTPIALAAANGGQEGHGTGYLATTNDVDLYSFPVAAGGRQIVYMHITGPMTTPPPTPKFGSLEYNLLDPMGQSVASGHMANDGLAINLSTAVLAAVPGTYSLRISGFKPQNSTTPIAGDLTLKYDVEVRVLPDLDTSEGTGGNDTLMNAKVVTLTSGGTASLTGKLAYIADDEWFRVTLPASARPTVLRWRTTVAAGGGRYAALSNTPTRQVRVVKTVADKAACATDPSVCPHSFTDPASREGQLVADYCKTSTPTQCLLSQHVETQRFDNFKNLVGALPIAASGASTDVYVVFRDEGLGSVKYADDRDWSIALERVVDADEEGRVGTPAPVALGSATVQGELTFGHGRIVDPFDINSGEGIRGPQDYDAWDTDQDLFAFSIGGAADLSWSLEWELTNLDGGAPPAELGLELTFCAATGAVPDGGLCADPFERLVAYTSDKLSPWYLPNNQTTAQVAFDKKVVGNATVVTVKPVGCWCIPTARVAAQKFYVNAVALNRVENSPLKYVVRQAVATYPSGTCPVVATGCGFLK